MRTLSVFIAMSLDGYIAQPNNDLSFLKVVEKAGEDYGYRMFTETIDTIIVGRKTYDWVYNEVGPGHYDNGRNKVYVITRTERPPSGNAEFYTGDLAELVKKLKSENGKKLYCDGGAEIITELLKHHLIDDFIVSIIPVMVGDGIRLFKNGIPQQDLELVEFKRYDTGLVQLHYKPKMN